MEVKNGECHFTIPDGFYDDPCSGEGPSSTTTLGDGHSYQNAFACMRCECSTSLQTSFVGAAIGFALAVVLGGVAFAVVIAVRRSKEDSDGKFVDSPPPYEKS